MSRVGKKPIAIPKGVSVAIDGSHIKVKGGKGELEFTFNPDISIKQEAGQIVVERPSDARHHRMLHGLTRALLNNMIVGVSSGFTRVLQIEGVGYKAELKGQDLVLSLGYSHPITVSPPKNVTFEVTAESKGREIIIKGIDKQVVGEIASYIRKQRPPEPYKGKGVRYRGEFVRAKEGKSGKGKGK